MYSSGLAAFFVISLHLRNAGAAECDANVLSCSKDAKSGSADPCCVPTPEGLFVFRQRFEPDVGSDAGSWGIDGLDVLERVVYYIAAS